jgi:hypothetical protein
VQDSYEVCPENYVQLEPALRSGLHNGINQPAQNCAVAVGA